MGRRGRDCMVLGYTTVFVILSTEVVSSNPADVLDTALCDKVYE